MQIVNYRDFLMMANERPYLPDISQVKGKMAEPVTEAQKACLRRNGVGYSGLQCKAQASAVLDVVIRRSNSSMATPGQLWAMHRRGFKDVSGFTFLEAQKILDQIGYTR